MITKYLGFGNLSNLEGVNLPTGLYWRNCVHGTWRGQLRVVLLAVAIDLNVYVQWSGFPMVDIGVVVWRK